MNKKKLFQFPICFTIVFLFCSCKPSKNNAVQTEPTTTPSAMPTHCADFRIPAHNTRNIQNIEDQISNFDPFIVTRDLTFWNKNSGEYLGQLETNYWSMKTTFSSNHYFLATWGDDYIIRIYGVRE